MMNQAGPFHDRSTTLSDVISPASERVGVEKDRLGGTASTVTHQHEHPQFQDWLESNVPSWRGLLETHESDTISGTADP